MDFAFSEEQELLRASAREFLAEQYPLDRVAELVDDAAGAASAVGMAGAAGAPRTAGAAGAAGSAGSAGSGGSGGAAGSGGSGGSVGEPGWLAQCWKQLADLGWLDAELGLLDHVVVFEETGYGLLPAPLFSTLALALPAVEHSSGAATLRDAVAAGELRLTMAWAEAGRRQDLRSAGRGEVTVSDDGLVSGRTVLVPDASAVNAFVVATAGGGLRLVRAADATITPRATSDRSRRLADVAFEKAPSTLLVPADSLAAVLATTERRVLVLAAAEAVGVARRAVDIAVAYAGSREQFGKPIGTYQAVSHQIVDAFAATELARSLTYWAAWSVAESDDLADAACSAAKSSAAEAAVHACERAIQVCGGVGFTWEHVLHRLYKRALWLEAFAGHGRTHRARVANAVL
jgi:alkylation response protein AidB-like acyl-CoA dehydrogenase